MRVYAQLLEEVEQFGERGVDEQLGLHEIGLVSERALGGPEARAYLMIVRVVPEAGRAVGVLVDFHLASEVATSDADVIDLKGGVVLPDCRIVIDRVGVEDRPECFIMLHTEEVVEKFK